MMSASTVSSTALRWWPFSTELTYASVRIRGTQIISELTSQGVDAALFEAGQPAPRVLVLAKRYDPESLRTARELQSKGTRVVLDMCDNHLFSETQNSAAEIRTSHLRQALGMVDATIASTGALADVLREAAPSGMPMYVIGDAYEEPFEEPLVLTRHRLSAEFRFARLRARLAFKPPATRLLWFGQHGTSQATGGMLDLGTLTGALNMVARGRSLSLTVISNHEGKFRQLRAKSAVPMHYLPWDRATFSRAARLHHIAILPIQHNPFTVCKTNNRVATSLLHGLAVVADPIPSYQEFSESIKLGHWEDSIAHYCDRPETRKADVARGVTHLKARWSIGQIAQSWLETLTKIAASPSSPHP